MLGVVFYFLLPAAAGIAVAWWFRRRLAAMRLNIYLFWLMIGTLSPLLVGQILALAMTGAVEAGGPSALMVGPLMAGVTAGFGWLGGAIGFKLTHTGEQE